MLTRVYLNNINIQLMYMYFKIYQKFTKNLRGEWIHANKKKSKKCLTKYIKFATINQTFIYYITYNVLHIM